jgi:hypothetical protein
MGCAEHADVHTSGNVFTVRAGRKAPCPPTEVPVSELGSDGRPATPGWFRYFRGTIPLKAVQIERVASKLGNLLYVREDLHGGSYGREDLSKFEKRHKVTRWEPFDKEAADLARRDQEEREAAEAQVRSDLLYKEVMNKQIAVKEALSSHSPLAETVSNEFLRRHPGGGLFKRNRIVYRDEFGGGWTLGEGFKRDGLVTLEHGLVIHCSADGEPLHRDVLGSNCGTPLFLPTTLLSHLTTVNCHACGRAVRVKGKKQTECVRLKPILDGIRSDLYRRLAELGYAPAIVLDGEIRVGDAAVRVIGHYEVLPGGNVYSNIDPARVISVVVDETDDELLAKAQGTVFCFIDLVMQRPQATEFDTCLARIVAAEPTPALPRVDQPALKPKARTKHRKPRRTSPQPVVRVVCYSSNAKLNGAVGDARALSHRRRKGAECDHFVDATFDDAVSQRSGCQRERLTRAQCNMLLAFLLAARADDPHLEPTTVSWVPNVSSEASRKKTFESMRRAIDLVVSGRRKYRLFQSRRQNQGGPQLYAFQPLDGASYCFLFSQRDVDSLTAQRSPAR